MNGTVGIYVDIEGSRTLLRSSYADALTQITGSVQDIYDLGTKAYNSSKARIFAYQFGDGLFVQPDVGGKDVSEILVIAVVMLQRRLTKNGVASAGIARGEFGDIMECYSDDLTRDRYGGIVNMGSGLLTVSPVMGTALGNAAGLTVPRGPRLIFEDSLERDFRQFREWFIAKDTFVDEIGGTTEVNWLVCLDKRIQQVHWEAFGFIPSAELLKDLYTRYVQRSHLGNTPGFREFLDLLKCL